MTIQEKAARIIELIGGETNVKQVSHCITRLRFNLNDERKADVPRLKALEGILGVVNQGGQTQVVIGGEAVKVFREVIKQYPKLSSGIQGTETGPKKSIANRMIDTLSSILVQALTPIIGGGMLKGLLFLCTNFKILNNQSGTYMVLNIAADCMFYFFPFLLAVSAARKFKTQEFMAVSLAGILMYPSILQMAGKKEIIEFLGFIPIVPQNYAGSVLPIILSVWLFSYLYRFLEDRMPDVLSVVFTPLISLMVTAPVMLFGIAPLGFFIGEYVARGIQALIDAAPWLAGFVIGATRPFLVLMGMHHATRPIVQQQIATFGYTSYGAINVLSTFAQASVVLAIFFAARSKKLKQLASTTAVSAYIGITEPALYGVIVKHRAAMVGVTLGGGIGGMFASILGVKSYALAMPSLLTIPVLFGEKSPIPNVLLSVAITIGATIIITIILARGIFKLDESEYTGEALQTGTGAAGADREFSVCSPVEGTVKPLSALNDQTFSGGLLGKTFAISPRTGRIIAPADAVVDSVAETKHALQLITGAGAELLIHAGLDTVKLNGKHFEAAVKDGQKVKQGDLLLTFDKQAIEREGFETDVVMVIANAADFASIVPVKTEGPVAEGDVIFAVKR